MTLPEAPKFDKCKYIYEKSRERHVWQQKSSFIFHKLFTPHCHFFSFEHRLRELVAGLKALAEIESNVIDMFQLNIR